MVSSKVNKDVVYEEKRTIYPEDVGYESSIYEINAFNKNIIITLGKEKYQYENLNLVFLPIYLVSMQNSIEGCLGVFEVNKNHLLKIYDEDGDVNLDKLNPPLFFEFAERLINRTENTDVEKYLTYWSNLEKQVQEQQIENIKNKGKKEDDNENIKNKDNEDNNENMKNNKNDEDEIEEDDNDIMKLSKKTKIQQQQQKEKNKIFKLKRTFQMPAELKEETEEDSNKIEKEFKQSPNNNWIQKYTKNNYYDIHNVESNGDCFFATIRDAFAQIGKITSVEQLRKQLANELTNVVYDNNMEVYNTYSIRIQDLTKKLKELKNDIENLKNQLKNETNKKNKELLVQQANNKKNEFVNIKKELEETKHEQITEFGDLSNIDSIDKYRDFIQTSQYWANEWAISVIEKLLNVKVIIFNEDTYEGGDNANVLYLNCGINNNTNVLECGLNIEGNFNPNYYIMATIGGKHYQLISYKNKKILSFKEIPYCIKIAIINKCIEKNGGTFNSIKEFRDFKNKLFGVLDDENNENENVNEEENEKNTELYDENNVLVFHSKSVAKAKPGKGAGEHLSNPNDYIQLGMIDNWRRKLDDTWTEASFTIDGKRYASVEHYYQSAKFKKGFPDFAHLFSLDANDNKDDENNIATNIELCKIAGSKTGKSGKLVLRKKEIVIDPDFYSSFRNIEERKKAVYAKFTQNMDMKEILLLTNRAKLCHYVAKNPQEIDNILMEVRQML